MRKNSVPIAYLFGSDDPLFDDYYDSNLYAIKITKNSRTTILQGERHLMEIDVPKRVANETKLFIQNSQINYDKQ